MTKKNWQPVLMALSVIALVAYAGCGGNELTEAPAGETQAVATVVLDGEPDDVAAPWTLEGPNDFSLSGVRDSTLENVEPGRYTVTWGPVGDWMTPLPEVSQVRSTERRRFEGRYFAPATAAIGALEMVTIDVPFVTVAYRDTFYSPVIGGTEPDSTEYALEWEDNITFVIGSPRTYTDEDDVEVPGELGRSADEVQTEIWLTQGFTMAADEITNGEFVNSLQWALEEDPSLITVDAENGLVLDALGSPAQVLVDLNVNPAITFDLESQRFGASNPELPATGISWFGAAAYCDWRNSNDNLPLAYDHDTWECNDGDPYRARGFRLPTEAEWEYACRAGAETAYNLGENQATGCDDETLDGIGWYCGNANTMSHPVGEMANDNAWGLRDMHGNVWEWCNDWYDAYEQNEYWLTDEFGRPIIGMDGLPIFVAVRSVEDPVGAEGDPEDTSQRRVMRSGGWRNTAKFCRSAQRESKVPDYPHDAVGFRPARSILTP